MRRLSVAIVFVVVGGMVAVVGSATSATLEDPAAKTTSPPGTTASPTSSTVVMSTTTASIVSSSASVAAPQSTLPPTTNGSEMFTFGDIQIPPGQPGQLSVVLAQTIDASDVMEGTDDLIVVVRNDRDVTVYTILVSITGTDESGAETFSTLVLIETAGVAPGEWTFGREDLVPRIDQTSHFDLYFQDVGGPADNVGLEVTQAQFSDDAIVGTILNELDETAVDNVQVNVACFHESQITAFPLATADPQVLGSGESANFSTTAPIDRTTCTEFAVFAVGRPASDVGSAETVAPATVVDVIETVLPVSESSQVVTDSSLVFVTEETIGASVVEDDVMESALLSVEALGGEWEIDEGPELFEDGEPFTYCPTGTEILPFAVGGTTTFIPSRTDESISPSVDDLSEFVLVYSAAEDLVSWFDGLESCVGEAWEESSDPVEHVTLERFDVPDLGDQSRGFRTIYAHSAGPVHDFTAEYVQVGEVLVIVGLSSDGLDEPTYEPIDRSVLNQLTAVAVAQVGATLG